VAGDGDLGGYDADLHPADDGGEGPVGEVAEHGRAAAGVQPDQELGAGAGDVGEEVPGVEAPVHQDQHRLVQQVQQLAAQSSPPVAVLPNAAPSRARLPVSARTMNWMTG
jgi:hypothetical protein